MSKKVSAAEWREFATLVKMRPISCRPQSEHPLVGKRRAICGHGLVGYAVRMTSAQFDSRSVEELFEVALRSDEDTAWDAVMAFHWRDPLISDRIAIAFAGNSESNPLADIAGVAIWASVSEDVDQKIRDQIRAGVFPLKLKAEDWKSGNINWLIDVIAPNSKACTNVVANFRQVVKEGEIRLHPLITRLVERFSFGHQSCERRPRPKYRKVVTQ